MKTLPQAISWAEQQIDKTLSWSGWSQCVSLIRYYLKFLDAWQFPPVDGAVNMNDVSWPGEQFDKLDRPEPGCIAVWGAIATNKWGHTDIVVAVFKDKLVCIGQNYVNPVMGGQQGSPTKRYEVKWPSSRAVTFYRPKFVPEAVPSEVPAAPVSPGQYVIKKGDTFWDLENTHAWPHGTLQQLNPRVQPTTLQIGQQIAVPVADNQPAPAAQHEYIVQPGDNLSAIANKLGLSSWRPLYDKNRLVIGDNPNLIKPGQRLLLP